AKRAHKQRNVKVRVRIVDLERDGHMREKRLHPFRCEVPARLEREAIRAEGDRPGAEECAESAIIVRRANANGRPHTLIFGLEDDCNAARGTTSRDIQHVCRYRAHSSTILLRRSSVIFFCSSAAMRSSASASLPKRRCAMA